MPRRVQQPLHRPARNAQYPPGFFLLQALVVALPQRLKLIE
jgi:hypothetical protein